MHFSIFDDLLAMCFLSLFWLRHFLKFCSFKVDLGSNLGALLAYLGTLEIVLKR